MTEFYVVRHGQTSWNVLCKCQGITDIPLSEVGINQAKVLANDIFNRELNFDVYISSNLTRAIQTCKIIKDRLNDNSQIIIKPDITERNFGELEGKSFEFVGQVFEKNLQNTYPGFENNEDLVKRTINCLNKLAKEYPNKKILIVSHSNTIKAMAYYLDKNKYNFGTKIPNVNVSKFTYDTDLHLEDLYFIKGLGEDKTKIKE